VAGLLCLATIVTAPQALAAVGRSGGVVTDYAGTGIDGPTEITVGSDGALWFLNQNNNSIGRITTAGVVSNFTATGIDMPTSITEGPDGALWFTNQGSDSIGRITTAGIVTTFTTAGIGEPFGITTGPDGALWFSNGTSDSIVRMTTAGVFTFYDANSTGDSSPGQITVGPDGNLWFANGDTIGRITTAGVVTNYDIPAGNTVGITTGSDSALWFTYDGVGEVGRITTTDSVTEVTTGAMADPSDITPGPDGALWFNDSGGVNDIGRLTTSGTLTTFDGPGIDRVGGIVAGPDGAIWFTNENGASIGRITTPAYDLASPTSGAPKSHVTVAGAGFTAGETVTTTYLTGLKKPTSVKICTTTATSTGTFSCSGGLAGKESGAEGIHTIKAVGTTSRLDVTTGFTLT
jgi:virginiamycin B lyase